MENILIALLGESLFKVTALSVAEPEVVEATVLADKRSFLGFGSVARFEGELYCGLVLQLGRVFVVNLVILVRFVVLVVELVRLLRGLARLLRELAMLLRSLARLLLGVVSLDLLGVARCSFNRGCLVILILRGVRGRLSMNRNGGLSFLALGSLRGSCNLKSSDDLNLRGLRDSYSVHSRASVTLMVFAGMRGRLGVYSGACVALLLLVGLRDSYSVHSRTGVALMVFAGVGRSLTVCSSSGVALLTRGGWLRSSTAQNSVVLQRKKVVIERNLPDVVPVAAVVQERSTILVDNERGVNCIRLVEWGTLVLITSRKECAMVLPPLLDVLGRCNTDCTVTAAGPADSVEAVELALPFNGGGSPWSMPVPMSLDKTVIFQDSADFLPRAVQVGRSEDGEVHASLEQVEGAVGFQDVRVMCRDIGVIGHWVFIGKGECVGQIPDLHVGEHLNARREGCRQIADGCQRQQIRESDHWVLAIQAKVNEEKAKSKKYI